MPQFISETPDFFFLSNKRKGLKMFMFKLSRASNFFCFVEKEQKAETVSDTGAAHPARASAICSSLEMVVKGVHFGRQETVTSWRLVVASSRVGRGSKDLPHASSHLQRRQREHGQLPAEQMRNFAARKTRRAEPTKDAQTAHAYPQDTRAQKGER